MGDSQHTTKDYERKVARWRSILVDAAITGSKADTRRVVDEMSDTLGIER